MLAATALACLVLPLLKIELRPAQTYLIIIVGGIVLSGIALACAHGRMHTAVRQVEARSRKAMAETERLATELRRERDFSATVLDTAGALVVVCDRHGRIKKFNDACERLTQFREVDVVDRPIWATLLEPADGRMMQAAMEALDGGRVRVRADAARRTEVTWRDRQGTQHRIAFTITVLLGPAGDVEFFVATGVDVTEQRRNHDYLLQLATTDPLTGLVNRTTFHSTLGVALDGNKGGRGAALLFCDLDGFKGINDTRGHAAGDELLIAVGQRLRRQVRQHDVVARMGGDEFVVLCPGLDEIAAHRLAERIRRAIAAPYGLTVGTVEVGVSVGVAYAGVGDDPERVLAIADQEMYRAKQRTKTGRWVPPPSMRAPSV